MVRQRSDLTFQYNQTQGRHGWLRLTPAYSIKAALQFLDDTTRTGRVLDPFSGTGTTGLLCAEENIVCDLVELNPFLVWFARVKTRNYIPSALEQAEKSVTVISNLVRENLGKTAWMPPIRTIDRWWSPTRLIVLSQIFAQLQSLKDTLSPSALDLLLIAFCRLIIQWSNAAFNHQSMSFKEPPQAQLFERNEPEEILASFGQIAAQIFRHARQPVGREPTVIEGDSRLVGQLVEGPYTHVITSPPYPNRMSYIRELRPYMYWLGFLTEAKQAGDLDWQAIGGTWGIATSRLSAWMPQGPTIEHAGFYAMIEDIASTDKKHGQLLANYVHRYFVDTMTHLLSLKHVLAPHARVVYIVGNSKFYDALVPVERIYASIMRQCGFSNPTIEVMRKRNSKKELREFAVIASVP